MFRIQHSPFLSRRKLKLSEATNGIDSLYVSSTGWAMWGLEEGRNRDLQYFEIMLDSALVSTTTATFFQFDLSGLTEGDTCIVQVRPVYLSDTCDWQACEWVYRPCSDFQGSTTGLSWSLHNEGIQLSWDYPEGEFLGAMLFRDGELLGFTEENDFLDETVELHGEVDYGLR